MPGKHVRFQDIPTPQSPESPRSPRASTPCYIHAAISPLHAQAAQCDLSLPSKYRPFPSSLPSHVLAEPATSPPLPSMTITCRNLPWAVRVAPSGQSKQGSFVTVNDVVDTLRRAMRVIVTKAEFDQVQTVDGQRRIEDAYRRRYQKINNEQERSSGIRRVDFLMGRTTFAGLFSSGHDAESWELSVS